ncbi:MAG: SIS domain-containing protein [Alphaproteobacteria bacterium]|nr:SIS domain-containing protein [Alphaproteobacteria bacterium]MBL0718200.1 SIS domain-containing protein [Alphaproteobacteria bacterium]
MVLKEKKKNGSITKLNSILHKKFHRVNNRITDAVNIIQRESIAIELMGKALKEEPLKSEFIKALHLIEKVSGRGKLVVSGMGKSFHVARKIATTIASMGSSTFFVHPGEAAHGDLGMLNKKDAVLLLSNSGDTTELLPIITYCKEFKIPLMCMTRNEDGILAKSSDIKLILPNIEEVCRIGKVPTTSTTMMMVFGDALAIVSGDRLKFDMKKYKHFHPGGAIGASVRNRLDELSDQK